MSEAEPSNLDDWRNNATAAPAIPLTRSNGGTHPSPPLAPTLSTGHGGSLRPGGVACGGKTWNERHDALKLPVIGDALEIVARGVGAFRQRISSSVRVLQQRDRHGDVGDISRCQGKGDRSAFSIGQSMDF